ncbi:TraB/GumN family protein [Mucilaginibacter terrenus]|uniref:TraB/GumN family protein n=1 Tax=Mucilaginibacter terrenus TaxID=2482727 RepID=A0A3E2NWR2_9SPHI|nr:TraB/GumN family protein [Mucilaginibacter terrenus]RFZ85448.1 TraB/GumN family protein [Mucilaginibacter terrenus]
MIKFYQPCTSCFMVFKSARNFAVAIIGFAMLCSTASAQQKRPYNLLWKVTGQGMAKPSFLFGTMHVKDDRAFHFSDSVMLAIQSCPSFALEVHPDTVVKEMFITMSNRDSTRSLKNMLNKADYDKLAKRFKKKNGYPMGDIDPIQAESTLKPERERPDDRKTFVDAYLFGVARAMEKNIYGLENAGDQFKGYFGAHSTEIKERLAYLADSDNDEEELDQTDKLVTVYQEGNVDYIAEYMGEANIADSIMILRNGVMLNSMIARMKEQPIFTAVGVAHLPGENGLIKLLRDKGYIVTAVAADFTGVAEKYGTDYSELKWTAFTDESRGYSLEVPFTPIQTDKILGVNTVFFQDIANDMFFGAFAALESARGSQPVGQKAIDRMVKRLSANQQYKVASIKNILVDGKKAVDIFLKDNAGKGTRYRVVENNNMLYCLYAGNNFSSLNSFYANRFFNSFKSFNPNIEKNKSWITFKNDSAAFSVKIPVQPQLIHRIIPTKISQHTYNVDVNMYMSIDSANLQNYLVRHNDYPAGTFLAQPEKAFDALTKEMTSKGVKVISQKQIIKDGNEGRDLRLVMNNFNMHAQVFIRGNRVYMLLKQNISEGKPIEDNDDFFSSFTFMPYLRSELKEYALDGGNLTVKVFDKPRVIPDSTITYDSFLPKSTTFFTTNPASGDLFGVEHATISNYYRIANIDSLYKRLGNGLVKYSDTLVRDSAITVNGIGGHDFLIKAKESSNMHRYRLFISNDDVVYLSSYQSGKELYSDQSNMFFNSISKINETAPISLASSKAQLILNDLASTDSVTYKYARGALSYYKFQRDELPLLYKALHRSYDDDSLATGTRGKLIQLLADTNDVNTLSELTKLYNVIAKDKQELRPLILKTIVDANKKAGYDLYLNLLTGGESIESDNLYTAFRPMSDSLNFVVANSARIIPLFKNPHYRKNLLNVVNNMTNEKGKYDTYLKEHFNEITAHAMEDLNGYLMHKDSTSNNWYVGVYYYLELMNAIKRQPITNSFTNTIIQKDNYAGLVNNAAITRIKNHLSVSPTVLNKLLDSLSTRLGVLKALNDEKQLEKAPAKYRTQLAFAKTCLYNYLTEAEDITIDKIGLLGTVTNKGNLYYAFKFSSDSEKAEHLGIAGPFKSGSAKYNFKKYNAYADFGDSKVKNWQIQAKKIIPDLLASDAN